MIYYKSHFFNNTISNDDILKQQVLNKIKDEMKNGLSGYYNLPETSLKFIKEAQEIGASFSQIVIIGIGGSSLGIKAIESILKPVTKNAKEIIYFENSDPLDISEKIKKIKIDKCCFFVISKSGSTVETISIFKTLVKYFDLKLKNAKNIFTITDEGSALDEFAKNYFIKSFHIPKNVGGRFSVLSAVGVVPLSVANYNMLDVLEGAKNFLERFLSQKENHLLDKALYLYAKRETQTINVMFAYSNILENFTKWYIQLWGESLGKIDKNKNNVGLTPVGIIGSIDQHSFLQLIIEGPRDKNITFINIKDCKKDLKIADLNLKGLEKSNFLNNKKFCTLINEQCYATMQSVIDSKISSDIITLDTIDEKNTAELIIYYELLTSAVGILLEIDTYNQPGVELGKKILFNRLS